MNGRSEMEDGRWGLGFMARARAGKETDSSKPRAPLIRPDRVWTASGIPAAACNRSEPAPRIIREPGELRPLPDAICAAFGVFDGVHLGHQSVIQRMRNAARRSGAASVVVTFDRHPNQVVAPEHAPAPIQSLAQRLRAIGSLGVDVIWLIRFDARFSRTPAPDFVTRFVRDFGRVQGVWVGRGFTFGHRRQGNLDLLKRMGRDLGFRVRAVPPVEHGGAPISSTRIREAIGRGRLGAVRQMLGRPYSLAGRVVRGDRLGRRLGTPTANVEVRGLVLPPTGVYAVEAQTATGRYRGVANLGSRPTLGASESSRRLEVHLLDFKGDLYRTELEVTFREYLRPERRFDSLDALRAQIQRDIAAARAR